MRDAEGSNLDIADAKSMAGLNELDALEAARMPFGKKTQSFGMGFGVEVDGGAPGSQQGRQAADVVAMFVRDDDAVEAIQGMSQRGQAAQGFALSQARIHQQARLGSLEQGAIARTARRENAYAKADGSPPKKLQAKKAAAGIMAKARGGRQCDSRVFVKKTSAGQQIARQAEALERADDGGGNFSRLEEFQRGLLDILGRDGLDRGVQLFHAEEAPEVHLLARQVGHARARRFERKHQRTLELVLGPAQLLRRDQLFLQACKFAGNGAQHAFGGAAAGARIDREHARVRVRVQFAEDGVGQALALADILKQARGHAAAENVIEHR